MTRATRAAGLAAGLAAALAAACGASQNPARPLDAIGADGAFLGETLGERFTPDDDRFRATDRAGRWELREQVTIGGRPVDTVTFHEDDGVLERVRLEIAVRGEHHTAASKTQRCMPTMPHVVMDIP
ncbi:MAG TPA: hypothetical protein RMH80_01520, partial [Polyangiaceae bacterium LLY-WYZ-15_(1-7)]|nr:hypothetical protein [Polyangiaceae bacterium LLY-WYZ-15_(1-7)]